MTGGDEKEGERLALEKCKIFPDGIHAMALLTNADGANAIRFAKHCPCGAFVSSIDFDREAFEASSRTAPVLVPADGLHASERNKPS